ncbi:MAG: methyltransferase domain-containing protein [Flavobacteriaceae bacterium]|nr:methyltransferase domain-containing protein [Flavobacteriaceae bacterium]
MKDVFGTAILDYQQGNYTEDLVTSTSISDEDVLPLPYLFRDFSEMPVLEQTALELSKGSVLDVGCGAGSHSLYLTSKGLEVKSIDISKGAIKACQLRGLKNAHVLDVKNETTSFDTLLLLMNGSGIFQSLAHTPLVLKHLKTLLNPKGQILIDSSDIKYMYQDEDGGFWMDATKDYYGELDYTVGYKGEEATFSWMYLDFENLKIACDQVGLKCELLKEGPHFDFLAKLTVD